MVAERRRRGLLCPNWLVSSKALEKIDSMATTEAEKAELENFRKAITT